MKTSPMPGTELAPLKPLDALLSLLRFRLSRREQSVVLAVLLAVEPLTSREVACRTRLAYSHAKATVRTLVAWRILTRPPQGLLFQPDPARWRLLHHGYRPPVRLDRAALRMAETETGAAPPLTTPANPTSATIRGSTGCRQTFRVQYRWMR